MTEESDLSGDINRMEMLHIAREEAHRTLDNQLQNLEDIDDKAARILRLNLLLLSIVLTGFSIIAANNGVDTLTSAPGLLNTYFLLGMFSIILSTVIAALTYTASEYRVGMSGRDIEDILAAGQPPEKDLEDLLEGYSAWMQMNFKMTTKNAPLSTLVLLLLTYGIILLTAGVIHAFITPLGHLAASFILVIGVLLTVASGLIVQIQHYMKYRGSKAVSRQRTK